MTERYAAAALSDFAARLGRAVGLPQDRAKIQADILVEADLMGHATHGLNLLPAYLADIEAGKCRSKGEPEVIRDKGSVLLWDGKYLPGTWLTVAALDLAMGRAREHPVMTVSIRRSHHIACLAAYLKRATDRGLMAQICSSDPSMASVAPFGGLDAFVTPNPIALGIPTDGDPILIDVSASTTTNGLTGRLAKQGERLPGAWLLDSEGQASDDPAVLFQKTPGTILPLGGIELGHKGYGLALMVEALTSGLNGHGRARQPTQWGASVFLQVIDPGSFAGREDFAAEMGALARAARATRVRKGAPPVRLPGERSLQLRARQLETGVELYPGILQALKPWGEKLEIEPPRPI
jgi:LDH2 family malate/lactate/ureidoglycolate dehydrogenase